MDGAILLRPEFIQSVAPLMTDNHVRLKAHALRPPSRRLLDKQRVLPDDEIFPEPAQAHEVASADSQVASRKIIGRRRAPAWQEINELHDVVGRLDGMKRPDMPNDSPGDFRVVGERFGRPCQPIDRRFTIRVGECDQFPDGTLGTQVSGGSRQETRPAFYQPPTR
jgi:hypothetical protein